MITWPLLFASALAPLLCGAMVQAQQPASPPADDPIYFRSTADVSLAGNVLFDWPAAENGMREARTVMVCGMKGPQSFLSLRAGPDSSAEELDRLPPFANLDLTGETSADLGWAKVEGKAIKADEHGRTIADGPLGSTPTEGWVSTRYLCNFIH